jgi:hypothetical protein
MATLPCGRWWPSIHVRIRPRGTNAHPILTNVPGAPRLPTRSGSSMCGFLVKIGGHWLDSTLLVDDSSRALVGAGGFDRQHRSRVAHVCRQAIAQWGAPEAVISDHAGVVLALHPCLQQLGIRGSPMARGHPPAKPRRRGLCHPAPNARCRCGRLHRSHDGLSAACAVRPGRSVWGPLGASTHGYPGPDYDLSPEVMLGHARGRTVEPVRLRRVFRHR